MSVRTINEDVKLKSLQIVDASALFLLTDKNRHYLREWLPWLDRTQSVQDSEGFIQFVQKQEADKTGIVFGVWKDNVLVGVCSFQKIDASNRSANIGYWIGQEFAGQGIATIITKQLIEVGFSNLNLKRIEIRCATENLASQKVAEKSGLQFEGISRDCEWLYDHFVSHRVYAVIKY